MQTPVRHDARRTLQTPRFIFESSNPSCSASTPRFADTPRFLLGEETRRKQDLTLGDDIDTSDVELPSTLDNPVSAFPNRGRGSGAARDEIPDSEDDDELNQEESYAAIFEGRVDRDDDMEVRDIEDDYDLLFPTSPTQPETKRRRLSPSPARERARGTRRPGITETDRIVSSPEPGSSQSLRHSDPVSQQTGDILPSPPARPPPSTPFSGTTTQFHPPSSRIVLNARPPSTIKQSNTAASEPPENEATTPVRRPRFILPLTPSRRNEDDLPAVPPRSDPLFSPVASRTGRPVRPRRSAGAEYVSGGMAAEVRNWIFELNAQRQTSHYSTSQYPQKQTPTQSTLESTPQHPTHYLVTGIQEVTTSLPSRWRQSIGSTGRSNAAETTMVIPSHEHTELPSQCRRILLLGYPLSSPAEPSRNEVDAAGPLKRGDQIGIRKGVVWEMDMRTRMDPGAEDVNADRTPGVNLEKWLVGIEWDILSQTSI